MTVTEVARLAAVSQRTVERDIAAQVLPAHKTRKGRLRILSRDARTYRSRHSLRGRYLTPVAYAHAIGVSVGTVRRWITIGKLRPVIVNPRRMYITEAEHRRVFKRSITATAALILRSARADDTSSAPPSVTATPRLPHFLTVRELADLAGTTAAAIHRHIRKGVIPIEQLEQLGGPNGKIRIRRRGAEEYLSVRSD